MKKNLCYSILTLLLLSTGVIAQTLPVGLLENVEDAYRRSQLLGEDSVEGSYMIRPLNIGGSTLKPLFQDDRYKAAIYALPLVWQNQVNTHHPYGMNDGSMVQAKGYQTQLSAGIFAKVGPLSVQFRPEYTYAQNKDFTQLTPLSNNVFFTTPYSRYYNNIDLPQRYGNESYSRVTLGQSSVRLTFDPVSFGFSNENLWWGPGVRNSLLMSNNAPGFRHLSLNTSKPVKTAIGAFEAQIIGGRLEHSGFPSIRSDKFNEIIDKPNDWRYLSGMIVTYQPKWLPRLYLGFDRTFIVYREDMGHGFSAYFPIFSSPEKSSYDSETSPTGNLDDQAKRDQYISFFARWVMPESKAELYFDWGRNDHAYDIRDGIVEPEHTRAYVVGFRKLMGLAMPDEFIQIGIELTQLEKPANRDSRASETWYTHYQVRDGYTHKGQVLGAGIGPGSNLQTLDVAWVKGLKRIGIQFERQVQNNDLFYKFAYRSPDHTQYINRHWVDLAFGGNFAWDYKNFVLNSQLTYIKSLNYQYGWKTGTSYWDWEKQDAKNLHFKVGLLYNW